MIEKFCKWHESKANVFLHIVAFVILIYGLWAHDILWIVIAILVFLLGHAIQYLTSKKAKPKGKRR
jgi:predicted membrane protein